MCTGSGGDISGNRKVTRVLCRDNLSAQVPLEVPGDGTEGTSTDLAELGQHLPEQGVKCGELAAQVYIALKTAAVGQGVQVGYLIQELLHRAPLQLQKLIHEAQEVLL
jgi:hypothetical protein